MPLVYMSTLCWRPWNHKCLNLDVQCLKHQTSPPEKCDFLSVRSTCSENVSNLSTTLSYPLREEQNLFPAKMWLRNEQTHNQTLFYDWQKQRRIELDVTEWLALTLKQLLPLQCTLPTLITLIKLTMAKACTKTGVHILMTSLITVVLQHIYVFFMENGEALVNSSES